MWKIGRIRCRPRWTDDGARQRLNSELGGGDAAGWSLDCGVAACPSDSLYVALFVECDSRDATEYSVYGPGKMCAEIVTEVTDKEVERLVLRIAVHNTSLRERLLRMLFCAPRKLQKHVRH